MVALHHIEESASSRANTPQLRAFLELGFRPLYLAACFWAAFSVAFWIYTPHLLSGPLSGVAWHAHEMLWGFIATIAVGFLLTAGPTWTNRPTLRGTALAVTLLFWLTARLGFLAGGSMLFLLAAIGELAFFLIAALALARAIYSSRSQRNYGIPPLLLGLGLADALFLYGVSQGNYATLMRGFSTGLLCMALITLLIARRVIPFFAMRAIPGLQIPMHTRSGHWQLVMGVLALIFGLLGQQHAMAVAVAICGVIALFQVYAWKPWAVRRTPLLWILYVGYTGLGLGLLTAACHAAGFITRSAWPVHLIGIAGFSTLIIGMVTRTALGHLGRPLQADATMVASYALVIAAAILRLLALVPSPFALAALHASAAAWIVAFAFYLWRFFPMMIRPRPNSPSGIISISPKAS